MKKAREHYKKGRDHASKVNKSTKTHAKHRAKAKDMRSGKTKLSRTAR